MRRSWAAERSSCGLERLAISSMSVSNLVRNTAPREKKKRERERDCATIDDMFVSLQGLEQGSVIDWDLGSIRYKQSQRNSSTRLLKARFGRNGRWRLGPNRLRSKVSSSHSRESVAPSNQSTVEDPRHSRIPVAPSYHAQSTFSSGLSRTIHAYHYHTLASLNQLFLFAVRE